MKSGIRSAFAASLSVALAILTSRGSAAVVNFDNTGGDSTWENATNWDTDTVATGADTITIPTGFNVTRASLLRLNNEAPGTLQIASGASLTINGDLQLDRAPAQVVIDGTLIFASGGTKSNMENGAAQGTYTLSGTIQFNDYNNGIASSGVSAGTPLLNFVQVGANMKALGMNAGDFTNLNGKLSATSPFFGINGTPVRNTGTPTDSTGADIVGGLYLARTDTTDSVTLTLTEVVVPPRDPWISTVENVDLGSISPDAGIQPFSVTVTNLGTLDLFGTGAFLTGDDASSFSIVTDFTSTVAASGTVDVDLTFNSGGIPGTYTANLELDSNDPEEPTRIIPITVLVFHDPVISVPPVILAGPYSLALAGPHTFTVPVSNTGASANLTLTPTLVGDDAAFFSVTSTGSPIAAGNSGSITISFNPAAGIKQNYFTTLSIESNDALTPTVEVEIFANVVATPVPNLVLHYPFEEGVDATTEDAVSGMSVATNFAEWVLPGPDGSNSALDFSLASNPATRIDNTLGAFSGIAGSADRTIAAWVKTSNTGRNMIVAWGSSIAPDGALGRRASFMLNGGVLRFEIGGGFANGTANIADGNWHHVAISTTGTNTANTVFWVDGVLDPTSSFGNANPINSIARWVSIGGENQPGAGTGRFQGGIDDLRVYDKVLNATEVANLVSPGSSFQLTVAGYDPLTGILNLAATGIPAGQTFHLRQSTDLQSFGILSPAFDFDSTTPQPFAIPVDPETVPKLFFRAFEGPSVP